MIEVTFLSVLLGCNVFFFFLQDYVRAGCVSSISSDLFLSGSFDHTVKLYDARSPTGSTISVDHGSPVESVLMYPGNSIFVSVGKLHLLRV